MTELWHRYVLLHKRGGVPLDRGRPEMLDCAEVELQAEAARARKKSARAEEQELLRQLGVM